MSSLTLPGYKSKIRVLAGALPSLKDPGRMCATPFPSFRRLLAVFGAPWLEVHHSQLCLCLLGPSPSVCPSSSSKDPVCGALAHPGYDLILT